MKKSTPKHTLVLGIAPATWGLGFAVLEGKDVLVDWGGKHMKGRSQNAGSLKGVEELIDRHQPGVIALENTTAKGSLRVPRIRKLSQRIMTLAKSRNIRVVSFSRKQLKISFLPDGKGTKHAMAQIVANWFSDELAAFLPPKRKIGNKENPRLHIIDAVALALAFRKRMESR